MKLRRRLLAISLLTLFLVACSGSSDSTTPDVPPDFSPDPISLGTVYNAELGTVITSENIVLSGFNQELAISIANGEYKIDNGNWTSEEGTVTAGQTVTVRISAPENFVERDIDGEVVNPYTETELSIGDVTSVFTVYVMQKDDAEDLLPNALSLTELTPRFPGETVTLPKFTLSGISIPVLADLENGEISINGGEFQDGLVTISDGDEVQFRFATSDSYGTTNYYAYKIGDLLGVISATNFSEQEVPQDIVIKSYCDSVHFSHCDYPMEVTVWDENLESVTATYSLPEDGSALHIQNDHDGQLSMSVEGKYKDKSGDLKASITTYIDIPAGEYTPFLSSPVIAENPECKDITLNITRAFSQYLAIYSSPDAINSSLEFETTTSLDSSRQVELHVCGVPKIVIQNYDYESYGYKNIYFANIDLESVVDGESLDISLEHASVVTVVASKPIESIYTGTDFSLFESKFVIGSYYDSQASSGLSTADVDVFQAWEDSYWLRVGWGYNAPTDRSDSVVLSKIPMQELQQNVTSHIFKADFNHDIDMFNPYGSFAYTVTDGQPLVVELAVYFDRNDSSTSEVLSYTHTLITPSPLMGEASQIKFPQQQLINVDEYSVSGFDLILSATDDDEFDLALERYPSGKRVLHKSIYGIYN